MKGFRFFLVCFVPLCVYAQTYESRIYLAEGIRQDIYIGDIGQEHFFVQGMYDLMKEDLGKNDKASLYEPSTKHSQMYMAKVRKRNAIFLSKWNADLTKRDSFRLEGVEGAGRLFMAKAMIYDNKVYIYFTSNEADYKPAKLSMRIYDKSGREESRKEIGVIDDIVPIVSLSEDHSKVGFAGMTNYYVHDLKTGTFKTVNLQDKSLVNMVVTNSGVTYGMARELNPNIKVREKANCYDHLKYQQFKTFLKHSNNSYRHSMIDEMMKTDYHNILCQIDQDGKVTMKEATQQGTVLLGSSRVHFDEKKQQLVVTHMKLTSRMETSGFIVSKGKNVEQLDKYDIDFSEELYGKFLKELKEACYVPQGISAPTYTNSGTGHFYRFMVRDIAVDEAGSIYLMFEEFSWDPPPYPALQIVRDDPYMNYANARSFAEHIPAPHTVSRSLLLCKLGTDGKYEINPRPFGRDPHFGSCLIAGKLRGYCTYHAPRTHFIKTEHGLAIVKWRLTGKALNISQKTLQLCLYNMKGELKKIYHEQDGFSSARDFVPWNCAHNAVVGDKLIFSVRNVLSEQKVHKIQLD